MTPVTMMLGRILAIAQNTRKEAYRNRAFLVLVILGLVLNATGWALAKLAVPSQQTKVIQDFGYFSVSIVSVLCAVLTGVILLYKELDKKTIYTLLPKPVARLEVVLGKFVGLVTLIAALTLGLGLCWIASMGWQDALKVAGQPVVGECFKSLLLIGLEAMLVTSVALLFSSWTRPFLAGMFTFGYFLMGRCIFLLQEHLDAQNGALTKAGPIRAIAEAFTYVVPDLQTFNVSRELALGIPVPGDYLLASAGYATSFTAVFLVLAIYLFSRRDFV